MSDLWKRLLRDAWHRLGWRATMLVALVIANGFLEGVGITLLLPLLRAVGVGTAETDNAMVRLFDGALAAAGLGTGWPTVLVVVSGVFLLQGIVFLTQAWLAADLQNRYTAMWRHALFRALLAARWRFLVARKAGELVNVVIGETNRLSLAFSLSVQLLASAAFMVVYGTLAFLVSWRVTAVLVAVGVGLIAATRGIVHRGRKVGEGLSEGNDDLQVLAAEFLGGAKLVKASATEAEAADRLSEVVERLRGLYFRSSFHPNLLRAVFEFVGITCLVGMLAIGTQVLRLDPAAIAVVIALFVRFYPRLSTFQQSWQALNVMLPAIGTTTAMFAAAEADAEPRDDRPLPEEVGRRVSISVEGLTVVHGTRRAVDGLRMALPAGQTVAVVGPSGAGKSTLADALLGLVEPTAGQVRINGIALSALPLSAWRRAVGYVAQDTFLFHATVRENLRWGAQGASDAEIEDAARRACAHEFILGLSSGYDTLVGDRGVRMSGGERQRLGLARALVRRPALLILDEATSALDSASERIVLDAIAALHGETTILTIAHRLSTVRGVDHIYVMEQGSVVEEGTWDDLLGRPTRFQGLWRLQNSGR